VAVLTAGLLIPIYITQLPFGFAGDLIAVVYLFALARFFTALASLDAGSSFGGMGGSREMFVASMVEPALMLSIFAVALNVGSTNLGFISERPYQEWHRCCFPIPDTCICRIIYNRNSGNRAHTR